MPNPQGNLEFTDLPKGTEKFPRLSEELTQPRGPDRCQSCGGWRSLQIWIEHDDKDQPESTLVCLCVSCGDRLIEPHPRLYARMSQHYPGPGTMEICVACRWRQEFDCHSPLADWNGGIGLEIEQADPVSAHLNMGSRRRNRWMTFYPEPAKACSGREQS